MLQRNFVRFVFPCRRIRCLSVIISCIWRESVVHLARNIAAGNYFSWNFFFLVTIRTDTTRAFDVCLWNGCHNTPQTQWCCSSRFFSKSIQHTTLPWYRTISHTHVFLIIILFKISQHMWWTKITEFESARGVTYVFGRRGAFPFTRNCTSWFHNDRIYKLIFYLQYGHIIIAVVIAITRVGFPKQVFRPLQAPSHRVIPSI